MIDILNELHKNEMSFPELSIDNIGIDEKGNIKLIGWFDSWIKENRKIEFEFGAPEIIFGEDWNENADYFSLGTILYYLNIFYFILIRYYLMKKEIGLFNNQKFMEDVEQKKKREINFDEFDEEIKNLFQMLMNKDPEKRNQINKIDNYSINSKNLFLDKFKNLI